MQPIIEAQRVINKLHETSAFTVICEQISLFEATYQVRPEIVQVTVQCKMAIVQELMRTMQFPAGEAILEPFFINGIPIVFSYSLGTDYMKLTNRRALASITL